MSRLARISNISATETRGVAVVFGLAAILLVAAAVQFPLALNHDAAWHFETSFRLLDGARFGDGVYDVNPPMSAWLFTLPAALCIFTGASPVVVFKLFSFAVLLAVLAECARLLPRIMPQGASQMALLFLAFALLLLPAYDFGQREHLVAGLTLPYVLLAAARVNNARVPLIEAIVIGCVGAFGVGVKPYFIALPICVELWLLVCTRKPRLLFRPEVLGMALVLMAYVAAVFLWAPDYLFRVVPDALVTYGAFHTPWTALIEAFAVRLAPYLFGALVAIAAAKRGQRLTPATGAALAAGAGFLIAALVQRKGWAYQIYPVAMYCVFLTGLGVATRERERRGFAAIATATVLAAGLSGIVSFAMDGFSPAGTTARVHTLAKIFEQHTGPNRRVFGFITSPRDVHPAVLEARVCWADPSGVLVFLPAMLNEIAHPDSNAAKTLTIGNRRNRQLVAGLTVAKPGVIVVDAASQKLGIRQPGFDYLKFFTRYPGFASFMRGYTEQKRVGQFRVFVRKG